MLTLRKSQERGWADHGWLQSHHSFSFASYHDPRFMGWGNLRVINEDRVAPGMGFGAHGHSNMEIVSYVLSGELAHQDSLGHVKRLPAGDVQRMSAGTGVRHSEFNPSHAQTTHFLQIWLQPDVQDLTPSYEQRTVSPAAKRGHLCLLAGPPGSGASVAVHADARLYVGQFDGAETAQLPLAAHRKGYVHLVRGRLQVNGQTLAGGDALLVQDEALLTFSQAQDAEVLAFDLAP